MLKEISQLGAAMGLAAFVGLLGPVSSGLAATTTYTCNGVPTNVDRTSITIDLDKLFLPFGWESDPPGNTWSGDWNLRIGYEVAVSTDAKGFKVACHSKGKLPNSDFQAIWASEKDWYVFKLGQKLVIKNVPLQGAVELKFDIIEVDPPSNIIDVIDADPNPHETNLRIIIHPDKQKAYLVPPGTTKEYDDPAHLIRFGKTKRFVGANSDFTPSNVNVVKSAIEMNITRGTIQQAATGQPPANTNTDTKTDTCHSYALEAVNWNQLAHQKGCANINPPVWSNDHQMHYDWCMQGDNYKTTAKHNLDRAQYVQSCPVNQSQVPATPPAVPGGCDAYANEAVKTAAKAEALGCGYSGVRWLQDYKSHYNFCISANPAIVIAEHVAREAQFAVCAAK